MCMCNMMQPVLTKVQNLVGQILIIFEDLGKSSPELSYCFVLGHRLDCIKNDFAKQRHECGF